MVAYLCKKVAFFRTRVQNSHPSNLPTEHLSRSCLSLCAPCKFGGAIWRAPQTVSSLRTITHSFTCKRNESCLEGKQGGWSFCHVSLFSSSTPKELRHDADLSHQHLPPPPLIMEREDLVDSPEHDLRDTDVRQDATMRKNSTRTTLAPLPPRN